MRDRITVSLKIFAKKMSREIQTYLYYCYYFCGRKTLYILFFSFLFNLKPSFSANKIIPKVKIAIIHSYPVGEWYYGINNGLKSKLKEFNVDSSLSLLSYDYESLKNKTNVERKKAVNEILASLTKEKLDFVVICDDEAALQMGSLVIEKLKKKVIFVGINHTPYTNWMSTIDKSLFSVVHEKYPIDKSVDMLKKLMPNLKTISILSSAGYTSILVSKQARESHAKIKKLKLRRVLNSSSWEEWKQFLKEENNISHNSLWILVPYEVFNEKKETVNIKEIGDWIRANTKLPTIGIISIHTKMGLLASIAVNPEGVGFQAAEQIFQILNGSSQEAIGAEATRYHNFEINLTEARRLNIEIPSQFLGIAKFVENQELPYGK